MQWTCSGSQYILFKFYINEITMASLHQRSVTMVSVKCVNPTLKTTDEHRFMRANISSPTWCRFERVTANHTAADGESWRWEPAYSKTHHRCCQIRLFHLVEYGLHSHICKEGHNVKGSFLASHRDWKIQVIICPNLPFFTSIFHKHTESFSELGTPIVRATYKRS